MNAHTTAPAAAAPTRPQSFRKRGLRYFFFRPKRPVRWLAPGQLVTTGLQVGLADRLGAYLDKRELQKLFPQATADEARDRDELWLDYVADTGDGFHATYAVAYLLGQRNLPVGGRRTLPRGEVLVMGGDQVYPTPSPEAYDDRLRGPFRAALPGVGPDEKPPTVYALPGNHDWYDGLTAFFRVFAGMRTTIGAWTTSQQRSYFAVRLPQNWWVFAVDAQKGAHIDDPQLEYFHAIVHEQLREGDRVILCTPEPAWVQGDKERTAYAATDYVMRKVVSVEGQTEWLSEKAKDPVWVKENPDDAPLTPKRVTVPLTLSGDWHHYSRYETSTPGAERRQLVTCGGGGAYLYGTHNLPGSITVPPTRMRPPKTAVSTEFDLRKRFPSAGRSFWLGLGALVRLPVRNLSFVFMLSVLQGFQIFEHRRTLGEGAATGLLLVTGLFFLLALFLAAGLVAGKRPWIRILILTVLHTAAQVQVAKFAVANWREFPSFDLSFWKPAPGWEQDLWTRANYALGIVHDLGQYMAYGLAAGIVSAVVVGLYLIVASLFGLNFNELFSSQRIEGYKAFLRMHVGRDGTLTVYVVGVRRVRRVGPGLISWHWRTTPEAKDPNAPWFEPRRRLRARVIETIVIP